MSAASRLPVSRVSLSIGPVAVRLTWSVFDSWSCRCMRGGRYCHRALTSVALVVSRLGVHAERRFTGHRTAQGATVDATARTNLFFDPLGFESSLFVFTGLDRLSRNRPLHLHPRVAKPVIRILFKAIIYGSVIVKCDVGEAPLRMQLRSRNAAKLREIASTDIVVAVRRSTSD